MSSKLAVAGWFALCARNLRIANYILCRSVCWLPLETNNRREKEEEEAFYARLWLLEDTTKIKRPTSLGFFHPPFYYLLAWIVLAKKKPG